MNFHNPPRTATLLIALVTVLVVALVAPTISHVRGQTPPGADRAAARAPAATSPTADLSQKRPFKPEELEQMLAAIALYPDPLLTQMLMASTYPLEIVQADRWVKENANVTGDALAKALEAQGWDASVKSLVNFPQILTMMSEKLDITMKIGDAMIGQQKDVMNAIQKLRAKANQKGYLQTNEQQKVTVEQVATTQQAAGGVQEPQQVIYIEPSQPDYIYVPDYDPGYVYSPWPYPGYPAYPYYPPGWLRPTHPIAWRSGVVLGLAWGYAWGRNDWHHGDCDIDVNRNVNFNRNIDRSKYQNRIQNLPANTPGNRPGNRGPGSTWRHDPAHRGGVAYRDRATAQQYGRANLQATQARQEFRGYTGTGRTQGYYSGANTAVNRGSASVTPSPNRPTAYSSNRPTYSTPSRNNAFDGVNRSGSTARVDSQRGQVSRSSSTYRASAAPTRSYSGGSRGGYSGGSRGGGASRGGGGGRGGGGRR